MKSLFRKIKGKPKAPKNKDKKASKAAKAKTNAKTAMALPTRESYTVEHLLQPIASISETAQSQRSALFVHKLRLCSITFDWVDDSKHQDAKEVKRLQLMELIEFIGKGKNIFVDGVLVEVVAMLRANLFRALPPMQPESDMEEDEPVFEPAWPHLQIVYEFFLRFIISGDVDVRALKPHIDVRFVNQLLQLFNSQDHRERDYLKTILHRIYAKFMSLRSHIRRSINNVFYIFIYETNQHNGVAELLEILGSIINGFADPLKQEHKNFLRNVLVPMHKVADLNAFQPQLSYCVTQFVDKDPRLAPVVVGGLLRYWPVTSSQKEVLFLNELEELLELTQPAEFGILIPTLFRQVKLCLDSDHFQVAERVLFLWHNEYISGLICDHRDRILPIIFPALHNHQHWNANINNLTANVLKIFNELDPELVQRCTEMQEKLTAEEAADRACKATAWEALQRRANTV